MAQETNPTSLNELESYWMSGAAQEPVLELDLKGRIKPIRQDGPPAARRRKTQVTVRLPELRVPPVRWD